MRRIYLVLVAVGLLACGPLPGDAAEVEPGAKATPEAEGAAGSGADGLEVTPVTIVDTLPDAMPVVWGGCAPSGFPGDDVCPRALAPDEGFQIHFGPADYDDADDVARFVVEPGGEKLFCQYVTAPNDSEIFYARWLNTLRPGSHHMIVNLADPTVPDGVGGCGRGDDVSEGLIGGNSTAVKFFDEVAPENQGIARSLPAHAKIVMQLHFFNTGEEPMLMEAWQNIYYMDPDDVKEVSATIFGLAGYEMDIPPGQSDIIKGVMTAPADLRIISLLSHNHNHTVRFSAYIERDGEKTKVYESYDWVHPAYLAYDTVNVNDVPDFDTQVPGGHTGTLELRKGDRLSWECEIVNDDLDIPLRWANRALDAEMCNIHGLYTPTFGSGWTAQLR